MMISLLRLHTASATVEVGPQAVSDAVAVVVSVAAAEVVGGDDDEVVIVVGGRGRGERGGSDGT